jgi:hypothetical protein
MAAIRVATLNVWGRSGDWRCARGVLRDGFRAPAPDLLALQETIVSGDDDLVAEILEPGYHVVHQSDRGKDGHGVSLASRWPVDVLGEGEPASHTASGGLSVHDPPRPCRGAGADRPGPLRQHHFPSWHPRTSTSGSFRRSLRPRALEDLVARTNAAHVVLAGDLDADPDATSVRPGAGAPRWTARASAPETHGRPPQAPVED